MALALRLATDAEKIQRDHVTFPEWGTRLTLDQYLERERVLREHPFSRGMRTWLLVDGAEVLGSCETFDNVSRVGASRGTSWSIASVYVEEKFRGRGYATRLMDLLCIEAERQGRQACVLFSDVGLRIYERASFVGVPATTDWVLAPREAEVPACDTWVPSLDEPPARVLQLEPTPEQVDWAHARERLYAKFLSRRAPAVHSAAVGAARATWAAYFKANELIVLWLQAGSADETAAVLDVARAEAHRCGLDRVRLWAPDRAAPPPAAAVENRKDELPMVRACAPHRIESWRQVQRALWV